MTDALVDLSLSSQSVFRAVMAAMSRPGRIETVVERDDAPAPLDGTLAALALMLADFETPVWLAADLARPETIDYLRFHTGAPIVADRARAQFALIADWAGLPGLDTFAQGTPEYPDASTTLIVRVEKLRADGGFGLAGPGIDGEARLGAKPLPPSFAAQMAANRQRFPLGVDIILACQGRIAALPRSVRLTD